MNRNNEMTHGLPYSFPYEATIETVVVGSDAANDASVPAPTGYLDGERRERDLGTGYGKRSGYARRNRYAGDSGHTRFRLG